MNIFVATSFLKIRGPMVHVQMLAKHLETRARIVVPKNNCYIANISECKT